MCRETRHVLPCPERVQPGPGRVTPLRWWAPLVAADLAARAPPEEVGVVGVDAVIPPRDVTLVDGPVPAARGDAHGDRPARGHGRRAVRETRRDIP